MNKGIAVAGNMIVDMMYPTNGLPRPGELVTITGDMTRSTGGCLCNDIIDLAALSSAAIFIGIVAISVANWRQR